MLYEEEIEYDALERERPSLLARLVRLNRYVLGLLILPISLFTFWPPYQQERTLQALVRQRAATRDELKKKDDLLKLKLDLIKNDPEYLEITARDRLSMQKEGETVVQFHNE
jgi:cell division protein FtsB